MQFGLSKSQGARLRAVEAQGEDVGRLASPCRVVYDRVAVSRKARVPQASTIKRQPPVRRRLDRLRSTNCSIRQYADHKTRRKQSHGDQGAFYSRTASWHERGGRTGAR